MPRIWYRLLLVICLAGVGHAPAQAQSRCDTSRIRTQFETSERFPSLTGCRPENVRPILQNFDYGLTIENHVTSRTIREGRIVTQRVQSSNVYVDLSTGPGPERDRDNDLVADIFRGVVGIISNLPPPDQQPPAAEPYRQPEPSPSDRFTNGMNTPTPPVQPVPTPQPEVVQPPPAAQPSEPPPAPEAQRPEVRRASDVQPPSAIVPVRPRPRQEQPPTPTPQPAERAEPVPAPPPDTPLEPETEVTPPASPQPQPPPEIVQPAASHFVIRGGENAKEGDQLVLIIRREGRDGINHLLELSYSDPSLLVSPPSQYEYEATMPDEIALRLRTAVAADADDHQLVVRLASEGGAQVRQPDSVTAFILDGTPWWRKLLEALASVPIWAVALTVVGVAGAGSLILMPRATCSIEGGRVSLGSRPLNKRWPAISVDTVIGDPTYSIPSPLPIGRRRDAEPSPA